MERRPPMIQADKPGLVFALLCVAFTAGFGWGAFIWWLLNRYFWVQP